MKDWHERYENVRREYIAACVEYDAADSALARATARRNSAERQLNQIYHERHAQLVGVVGSVGKP